MKESRFAQAEALLTKHIQIQPKAPDAAECYLLLGQAQAKLNRADDALRTFKGLTFRFPGTHWAAQSLEEQSLIHTQRRNPSEAQKCRDELLAKYPQSPTTARAWTGVANELFAAEKFAEAAAIYGKIEASLPAAAAQSFAIAKVFSESGGDTTKLLQIAEQAISEDRISVATPLLEYMAKSQRSGIHINRIKAKLAWCLYLNTEAENLERAESLWREVIKNSKPSDPWYSASKWHLVQLHSGPKNQWKEAVAICSGIVREQPVGTIAHEQALFVRAWLLTVHDQGKAAVDAFDDLAAAYPEKMKQPAIIGHRERALKSAAKQSEPRE